MGLEDRTAIIRGGARIGLGESEGVRAKEDAGIVIADVLQGQKATPSTLTSVSVKAEQLL